MKSNIIEGGTIQGDWMKVIYRKEHGRKLYSCFIYEKDAREDNFPVWFGTIKPVFKDRKYKGGFK